MYRRQFLHNAGFIFPAVVLAPSMVWATVTVQADVLVIQQSSFSDQEMVADVLKAVTGSMRRVDVSAVKQVIPVSNGFTVIMVNGDQYSTGKIIFQGSYKVMQEQSAVVVEKEGKELQLPYGSKGHEGKPELWAVSAKNLDMERMRSFVNRSGTAVMCMA